MQPRFHDSLNTLSAFSWGNDTSKQLHFNSGKPKEGGGCFACCWNTISSGIKSYTFLYSEGGKSSDVSDSLEEYTHCKRRFLPTGREGGFAQSIPNFLLWSSARIQVTAGRAARTAHEKLAAAAQGARGKAPASFPTCLLLPTGSSVHHAPLPAICSWARVWVLT